MARDAELLTAELELEPSDTARLISTTSQAARGRMTPPPKARAGAAADAARQGRAPVVLRNSRVCVADLAGAAGNGRLVGVPRGFASQESSGSHAIRTIHDFDHHAHARGSRPGSVPFRRAPSPAQGQEREARSSCSTPPRGRSPSSSTRTRPRSPSRTSSSTSTTGSTTT